MVVNCIVNAKQALWHQGAVEREVMPTPGVSEQYDTTGGSGRSGYVIYLRPNHPVSSSVWLGFCSKSTF